MPFLTVSPLWMGVMALSVQGTPAPPPDSVVATNPVSIGTIEDSLLPDTVLVFEGGPTLLLDTAPGIPTTALRLAFPISDATRPEAVNEVLRVLAVREMERRARDTGASVSGRRTPWGLVYEVSGAATEVEHLTYVLRGVMEPTLPDRILLQRIVSELAQDHAEAGERPESVLRDRLLEAQGRVGSSGSVEALRALRPSDLVREWRAAHDLARAVLTVVTPQEPAIVLSSLNFPSEVTRSAAPPDDRALEFDLSVRSPEVLRRWYGESFVVGSVTDATAPILALLLERSVPPFDGNTEIYVELRPDGEENVLLLSGAAHPGRGGDARTRVTSLLDDLVANLDGRSFERARSEASFRMQYGARSPAGMAATLGRFHETTGLPTAADAYARALRDVTIEDVRQLIERLRAQEPVTAEVRPR